MPGSAGKQIGLISARRGLRTNLSPQPSWCAMTAASAQIDGSGYDIRLSGNRMTTLRYRLTFSIEGNEWTILLSA